MTTLKLHLLGAPQIKLDGQLVNMDRRSAVALLIYLAVTGQAHTREFLATLFWPDYDPSSSYAYLRRAIWELKNTIGDGWLLADRQMVSMSQERTYWLDVDEFRHLSAGDDLESLALAAELYQGDFSAGFTLRDSSAYDDWLQFEGEALRRELRRVLRILTQNLRKVGDLAKASNYASRWLTHDPLDELAYRQMMQIQIESGHRSEALRLYEQCVQILDAELGLSPQVETTAIYERLAEGKSAVGESRLAENGLSIKSEVAHVLPSPPTSFVGRQEEITSLEQLLTNETNRLVTLIGPGGSGKTRLAIQIANNLIDQQAVEIKDGLSFVSLAPLNVVDSIVPAIANALAFSFYKEEDSSRERLIDYLRNRQLILILDNFEHLLNDESRNLLNDIIGHCPKVKLLVTSRARLNLHKENIFTVSGLAIPELQSFQEVSRSLVGPSSYSAIELFVQSARRIRSDFQVNKSNWTAIVEICRLVAGMPLGIELAAGWIDVLTPQEIADEMANNLDFLASDQVDIPARQRSMRAVFDSSWQLLNAEEQRVFRDLTVFRGGFTRTAAEKVGKASIKTLKSLVSKSWLQHGIDGRYVLHELLRQYGAEILLADENGWDAVRLRHAYYYANFADEQYTAMHGPRQKAAFEAFSTEIENIRTAWYSLLELGDMATIMGKISGSLYLYISIDAATEQWRSLIELTEEAWLIHQDDPSLKASRAIWLTFLISFRGLSMSWPLTDDAAMIEAWQISEEIDPVEDLGDWYVQLLRLFSWIQDRQTGLNKLHRFIKQLTKPYQSWTRAFASQLLADLLLYSDDWQEARPYLNEAVFLFRRLGDDLQLATTLMNLAYLNVLEGANDEAFDIATSAMNIFIELEMPAGQVNALNTLSDVSFKDGQFDQAFTYLQRRRLIFERIGHRRGVIDGLHWESLNAVRFSTLQHAMTTRHQATTLAQELGDPEFIAWSIFEMAEIERIGGNNESARQLYEDSRDLFSQNNHQMGEAFVLRGLGELSLFLKQYDKAAVYFDNYLQWARSAHHYWSEAFAHECLGRLALAQGRQLIAQQQASEALRLAWELRERDICMPAILDLAMLKAEEGHRIDAFALGLFVKEYFLCWQEIRDRASTWLEELSGQLTDTERSTAGKTSQELELEYVVSSLLEEFRQDDS